jgi:hypothetical protein
MPALVEATVQAVEPGSPSILLLCDDSTGEHSVGMYLHTGLARLCERPHALIRGKHLALRRVPKHPHLLWLWALNMLAAGQVGASCASVIAY